MALSHGLGFGQNIYLPCTLTPTCKTEQVTPWEAESVYLLYLWFSIPESYRSSFWSQMSSLLLYIQSILTEDTSHLFAFLSTEATISLPLCVEKRDRVLGFLKGIQIQPYILGGTKTETLHHTTIRIHIIFKSSQISDSRNEIFTYIMQLLIFLTLPYHCFH